MEKNLINSKFSFRRIKIKNKQQKFINLLFLIFVKDKDIFLLAFPIHSMPRICRE